MRSQALGEREGAPWQGGRDGKGEGMARSSGSGNGKGRARKGCPVRARKAEAAWRLEKISWCFPLSAHYL